jgi:hypothetical protein
MNNNPPEVVNVSGSVRTVGDTVRPAQHRDTSGRYRAREARLVGPYQRQPEGRGGIDSVTGEFRAGELDRSQLHDMDRVHAISSRQMQFVPPDWSCGADPVRRSHEGAAGAHALLNEMLSNPCHTTGGEVCNG